MKFAWIQTEKATCSVAKLCRWLAVTQSGFYASRARPESMHTRDDRRLQVLVRASFAASQQRYGSPRIHEDLIEQDEHVSRKRVVRLMQRRPHFVGNEPWPTMLRPSFPRLSHPRLAQAIPSIACIAQVSLGGTRGFRPRSRR